jgi:hypothetical protein
MSARPKPSTWNKPAFPVIFFQTHQKYLFSFVLVRFFSYPDRTGYVPAVKSACADIPCTMYYKKNNVFIIISEMGFYNPPLFQRTGKN